MLLDWEKFKTILKKQDNHVQLTLIRNNIDFILDFLTHLLEELKQCQSTKETSEKFPLAGSTLTLASTHPYIGYTPRIANLVVTCLLEYSKLDIESNTISQSNAQKEKSVFWCINRLRRFINVNIRDDQKQDTRALIQQISNLIDIKGNELPPQKISKLTDTCLSLIHEKESFGMIEKFVNCVIEHSDRLLLSDEFIYEIAQKKLIKPCYLSWSPSLKIKLLLNYHDLLEIEVLNLIQDYLLDTKLVLLNHEIIQLLQISSDLSQQFLRLLSDHIIQFSNWKLIRLGQSIHQCLRIPLFESCQQEIEKASFNHVETHTLFNIIQNYIYNGSILEVPDRRNEAWCLSLSFTRFLWYCVYHLIQWTQKKNEPWTSQMEDILVYINWIIYPSMDNRETESLTYFRSWIQSKPGKEELYDDIPKLWHNLLNSNHILIACFITTILFSIDHSHVDQQLLLIQSIFAEPERKKNSIIYGTTKKIILLDFLNDIQNHASLYPPLNFQLKFIKDYLVRNY